MPPSQRRSRLGVRRFLQNQLHALIFALLHAIFSLYIRIRQTVNLVCYQVSSVLYYHHATPQYIRKDVMGLARRPKHLSAILRVEQNHRAKADLERLIDETAELATWCACAEIPMLSVYEKTGELRRVASCAAATLVRASPGMRGDALTPPPLPFCFLQAS